MTNAKKKQLFFRKQNLPTLKLSNKTLGVLPPNHPKHLLQVITTEISWNYNINPSKWYMYKNDVFKATFRFKEVAHMIQDT